MNDIGAITTFFLLSLAGAIVLFRFFRSSAMVKHKTYQAGGAIAGFVIIYGILFASYSQVNTISNGKLQEKYDTLRQEHNMLRETNERLRAGARFSGKIGPVLRPIKIILAVASGEPDAKGNFSLKVQNLDLRQMPDPQLVVLTDDRHAFLVPGCVDGTSCKSHNLSLNIESEADTTGITVETKLVEAL